MVEDLDIYKWQLGAEVGDLLLIMIIFTQLLPSCKPDMSTKRLEVKASLCGNIQQSTTIQLDAYCLNKATV